MLKFAFSCLKFTSHHGPDNASESLPTFRLREIPELPWIVRESVLEPAHVHQSAVSAFLLERHRLDNRVSHVIAGIPLERRGLFNSWHLFALRL